MGFIPGHPGLIPGMEQPLPMNGPLGPDQYPPDTKPIMADLPFNMSSKMMSDMSSMSSKMMSDGSFNMSSMSADMISQHQQDFSSPGECSLY